MSSQANAKISTTGGRAPAALVAQAVAGDRAAFATLYNDHHGEVYRYLVARTKDRQLAEDLAQETFLRALRRIDTFKHLPTTAGFVGWLFVIARNLHLDHLKLFRTSHEVSVAEPFRTDVGEHSAEESALRDLDIVEAREAVTAAMTRLNPYQREAIRLRFFEELSVPEAAARMGKGVGAVKTLTFRAMRVMEQALVEGAAA
ncbi:RNA polymerase sigma factor [Streptomyces sp. NPDC048288]|uniref:RNA polymerase sigma factor n=1 Tax=Streptomyces sp. NPDC048288 TaxID=3365529 RepID=UPI0037177B0B